MPGGVNVPGFGPLPTVHPRAAICSQASIELAELLDAWAKRHGLTTSEFVWLVAESLESIGSRCVNIERRTGQE